MIEDDGPCTCYCADPDCCGKWWAGFDGSPNNPTCPIHTEDET